MENEKNLYDCLRLMFFLNLIILIFYSLVSTVTTYRICRTFEAYHFLSTVGNIPEPPFQMPVRALILYGGLTGISIWKNKYNESRKGRRLICCSIEILLCMGIDEALNFYYSGIALVVLADLVRYTKNHRLRLFSMSLLTAVYTIGRYEVIPFTMGRIPFSAYLNYYRQPVRGYLSGIESIMLSLNIMLFVYFMVMLFASQIAENERIRDLYNQLKEAHERLRNYSVELEHMTEIRERNRLAREIHDTLGHTLTGIIMGSEASLALFRSKPDEAEKRMAIIAENAREGLNDVRQSIKALRPDALEKHSLDKAIERLISNFQKTTMVLVYYEQLIGSLDFAIDEEDTIYRVVQECMTNAARHGYAKEIRIRMTRQEDWIIVDIRDDGAGCDKVVPGFGLRHMEERLALLGGSLICGNRTEDAQDGQKGFFVTASLPVRKKGKEF